VQEKGEGRVGEKVAHKVDRCRGSRLLDSTFCVGSISGGIVEGRGGIVPQDSCYAY
jgi:hypothetical protein